MNARGVAAVVALGMELAPLRDLAAWPPVGAVLEELPALARGHGSLSREQVAVVRRWAARWRALSPSLRAFYAAEVAEPGFGTGPTDGLVEAAIWRILEGEGRPAMSPKQEGALHARWRARYGSPTSQDLCPLPRKS